MNEITLLILIILNINSFVIGYLLGSKTSHGVLDSGPKSFFDKNKNQPTLQNSLSIDDKKFVTDIKTDGLERKYNTLGEVKKTEDNIANSVNKLKNLKG
jgi:hypothetical protein